MKQTFLDWLKDQLLAEGPHDWRPSDDELTLKINSLTNIELITYFDWYQGHRP
jgi:hypothetical protein